jgi:orotate phosphoribosyltransferase
VQRLNTHLFQLGEFVFASGRQNHFKIECDALTKEDWAALADQIAQRVAFSSVVGVPTGGELLARALSKYAVDKGPRLVVDDVLTTGGSILKLMKPHDVGFVVFARGELPPGVRALFTLEKLV